VLKSLMLDKYDILSRRVLVCHVVNNADNNEVLTKGWASVQSSQGYVILSPLASICYSNSKWGSTRPIIRQCGHAAHLKCVEAHTLSLHQRAAGEQPYDGRFAANIDDGEFLCPLCKQLSNILIPRDRFVDNISAGSLGEVEMKEAEGSITNQEVTVGGSEGSHTALRRLLCSSGKHFQSLKLNKMSQEALKDFGAHLSQAMDVPWERNSGWKRQNQQQWHPSIQRWDYEDEGGEADLCSSEKPVPRVKSALRHIRQEHIAWAAIGHSASAQESSTRGLEEALPFGVVASTSDPWSGYSCQIKDKHPMVLELKRTLAAVAGLFEVLMDELAEELLDKDEFACLSKRAFTVSTLLADIIEGKSWLQGLFETDASNQSLMVLWSQLTGLMCSIPCHVARDGQISQRSEARAAAAAMWIATGAGTASQPKKVGEPPVPFAVRKVIDVAALGGKSLQICPAWGTLKPFASELEHCQPAIPFRPAVACSFLYTPLLAWDLNTFAGAMFSTILVNDTANLPSSEDLLHLSQVLLVSRLVQAVVTPGGIAISNEVDDAEISNTWEMQEIEPEGSALAHLVRHYRDKVKFRKLSVEPAIFRKNRGEAFKPAVLLAAVGEALLPFARSLVLLLRACTAVIRERQRLGQINPTNDSQAEKVLETVMFGSDIMSCEDGFFIYKALQGPVPTAITQASGFWWTRIEQWLVAVTGWELHHGSRGKSLIPIIVTNGTDRSWCLQEEEPPGVASGTRSSEGAKGLNRAQRTEGSRASENNMEEEGMEIDGGVQEQRGFVHYNNALEADEEDSDEELMELDNEEIAVVGFPAGVVSDALLPRGGADGSDGHGDSSDENSSSVSDGDRCTSDREFAHVSRTPIISYQPSILAQGEIGAVRQGTFFESALANSVMADLSHLGLIHRRGKRKVQF